ncbi:unnamed protein product [Amoebophrya sp. A120]|nr:unnamed protein product [Amoebophrya sp. A120]|eukprot:GSA120T00005764001.1
MFKMSLEAASPAAANTCSSTATGSAEMSGGRAPAEHPRRREFRMVCTLGSGGFGTVKLVHARDNEAQCFAMKVIEKSHLLEAKLLDPKIKQRQQTERDVLVACADQRHPSIVQLLEAFQTNRKLYYVYEYCDGGELWDLVKVLGKLPVESFFRFYATEIVEALAFLHSHGILHRDLKLENVLLDTAGHAKICDFGCAKFFFRDTTASFKTVAADHSTMQGDQDDLPVGRTRSEMVVSRKSLMPPEYFETGEYGAELDSWQLGLMFYTMLEGRGLDLYAPELQRPLSVATEARSLVNDLLAPEHKARLGFPTGASLVQAHAFFQTAHQGGTTTIEPAQFWKDVRDRTWREPPDLDTAAMERIASWHCDWGRDSTLVDPNDVDLLPVSRFSTRLGSLRMRSISTRRDSCTAGARDPLGALVALGCESSDEDPDEEQLFENKKLLKKENTTETTAPACATFDAPTLLEKTPGQRETACSVATHVSPEGNNKTN